MVELLQPIVRRECRGNADPDPMDELWRRLFPELPEQVGDALQAGPLRRIGVRDHAMRSPTTIGSIPASSAARRTAAPPVSVSRKRHSAVLPVERITDLF